MQLPAAKKARPGSQGEGFPRTQLAGWKKRRGRGGESGRRGQSAVERRVTLTPAVEAVPPPHFACLRISLALREVRRRKPPPEAAFLLLQTG